MDVTDLDRIDWGKLSVDSLWTLSRVVIPIMEGEFQTEIAQRLGLTKAVVCTHMSRLRAELREQLDEQAA